MTTTADYYAAHLRRLRSAPGRRLWPHRRTTILVAAIVITPAAARYLLGTTADTRLEVVDRCIVEVTRNGLGDTTHVGDAICFDEQGRPTIVPAP